MFMNNYISVEWIQTRRGSEMLKFGGYKFSKSKSTRNKIRWRCSTKSRTRCKAALTTVNGYLVKCYMDHNH